MRRTISRDDLEAIIARGLDSGGVSRLTALSWAWDASGGCATPVGVELVGVEPKWRAAARGRKPARLFLDMDVPCRKCEPCRRSRANKWAAKAHAEVEQSYRTWFVTLTLNGDQRMLTRAAAQAAAAKEGLDFEALSEREQFRRWSAACYPAVQLYLKRLRKEAGPLRYLFVAEAHKDGTPHYHGLIHEPAPTENLKERMLRGHWRNHGLGFAEAKLADNFSVWYVCKYLTKEIHDKVRASFKYGENRLQYHLCDSPRSGA